MSAARGPISFTAVLAETSSCRSMCNKNSASARLNCVLHEYCFYFDCACVRVSLVFGCEVLSARAPIMLRRPRAVNRSAWITLSITSAGWFVWCCSGPPSTQTISRRRTAPTTSSRSAASLLSGLDRRLSSPAVRKCVFDCHCLLQEFYETVCEDSRLIPALKDQLPELEKIIKQK